MGFKKSSISYKETGMFSRVFTDYLNESVYLRALYENSPDLKSFKKAIENQNKYKAPRKILSEVIKNYYRINGGNKVSDATLKNISSLENENCYTLTTGHQLCLFTGPLYFIYKIITVINLAEKLKKEYPENDFVPVYWMASEDHDFAEINHVNLFGKKVEWQPRNPEGTVNAIGGPVGRMSVSSLTSVIESLFSIIGDSENACEMKQLISDSYSAGKNLSQATFSFVNALFGKYGLVVVEPDNAELKRLFAPVMEDELLNKQSIKLVNEVNEYLLHYRIEAKVHPRDINLFYIDENGRNRIEEKAGRYEIVKSRISFSPVEISGMLKSNPENFSPNVIFRPLYQQCILPNLAYIGGPAEVAYWLQYRKVFMHYNIPFPVIIPRNSVMFIDKTASQKMQKLGINHTDLFKDADALIDDFLNRNKNGLPEFEEEIILLGEIYASIGNKVLTVDPTLVPAVDAELQKQLNAIKNLETKILRVQKQKEGISINKIKKLKDKLFPDGAMEERTENFIPLYLQMGNSLFDFLKENFDPLDFRITILSET